MSDACPVFGILPRAAEHQRAAEDLARTLELPLLRDAPPDALVLELAGDGLALRSTAPGAPGAVRVDFGQLGYRRRHGSIRGEAIARAVGLKGGQELRVVDATAGFGTDAMMLASLGAQLRLIERSPVVAALLADGLARAAGDPGLAAATARVRLLRADAMEVLPELLAAEPADVIYLDPMYPEAGTKGQVKKEMQILRLLLGPPAEPAQLLELARGLARRVVVKRPVRAPRLAGPAPSHSLEGRSTRFDVYL